MSTLQTRTKVLICILITVTAYGIGRWSAPEKVVEKIKVVEVEKTKTKEHSKDRTKTTTTISENPNGSKTTTIVVANDVETGKSTTTNTSKSTESEKETIRASSKTTVLLLGAVDVTAPLGIDYGISASRSILGPISISVFGYKSGRLGAGVGLTF